MSESELVFHQDGIVYADSPQVAACFGKRHNNVVRAVDDLLKTEQIDSRYFIESTYQDASGRSYPCFRMTRDGFSLLVMGFSGKDALRFKIRFIEAFNEMERVIGLPQKPAALPSGSVVAQAPAIVASEKQQVVARPPSGAYLKGMKGFMQSFFDLCPEMSGPIRYAVAAQFAAKVGILVPPATLPSALYTATDVARSLGLTVNKLSRDDRYKDLKIDGYGVQTIVMDQTGTPRSNWNWTEAGRAAVLRAFGAKLIA